MGSKHGLKANPPFRVTIDAIILQRFCVIFIKIIYRKLPKTVNYYLKIPMYYFEKAQAAVHVPYIQICYDDAKHTMMMSAKMMPKMMILAKSKGMVI